MNLKKICEQLPNLISLDISGTNLAGLRTDTILGLEPRRAKPLDFLGIFDTTIEASSRENIPASRVCIWRLFNILYANNSFI